MRFLLYPRSCCSLSSYRVLRMFPDVLQIQESSLQHGQVARSWTLRDRWPNIVSYQTNSFVLMVASSENDDYIYTMSLFVLEPARWAKYMAGGNFFRSILQAYFVLWKEIGRRMNLRYIPETLQDLIEWTENYEETAMVPAISNHKVGQYTSDYMLSPVTDWFGVHKKLMCQVSLCLMEPRVRTAFMLPAPSPVMVTITRIFVSCFAIRARYSSFRLSSVRNLSLVKFQQRSSRKKMPRFHLAIFDKASWYRPEPKGISRIWQKILVKIGYLDEKPDGAETDAYLRQGPISLEQDGHEEVMKMAAEAQGCPVTGIWAL
ncbi:hypothetical protein ACEPAF_9149 [Sanghuangporus sanghuang]